MNLGLVALMKAMRMQPRPPGMSASPSVTARGPVELSCDAFCNPRVGQQTRSKQEENKKQTWKQTWKQEATVGKQYQAHIDDLLVGFAVQPAHGFLHRGELQANRESKVGSGGALSVDGPPIFLLVLQFGFGDDFAFKGLECRGNKRRVL